MPPRRLCAVSGSRADFGIYEGPLNALRNDPAFTVEVAATGMHLAPEFGMTVEAIEAAGFPVPARIETLDADDSWAGMSRAVGRGILGFTEFWCHHRPDLVLVLGDRFEMFAAAQAAFLARIPLAHIGGGDVTEGALDDGMRHAISKLSQIHFPTNEAARQRLIRMGEQPVHVHNVGSPGIDQIFRVDLLDRLAVERALGFRLRSRNLLITFHPVTLDSVPAIDQLGELFAAIEALGDDTGLMISLPNADAEGRALITSIEAFVQSHPNAVMRASFGAQLYLSCMAIADAVVGNSSSGLYEAPSLKRPTVNIGDRQKGRLRAASVVDCAPERRAIADAILAAYALDCTSVVNPYGDGKTSDRIHAVLGTYPDYAALVRKPFYDGS